jgi:fumarate hydratase subunit beta
MNEIKILHAPVFSHELNSLTAGDSVYLTGTIYTARDAAHRLIYQMIMEGKPLPVDFEDQVIYYAGPCPANPAISSDPAALPQAAVWMFIPPCCWTGG